jgi:hypothetical protein
LNSRSIFFVALLLCFVLLPGHAFSAFVPHQGDYFGYYEVIDVGSGSGDYAGYTEHTVVTGTENVNGVTGDGIVSVHFSYNWDFSSNDGSTYSNSSSGDFTFSSNTFRYVNGTDDQVGYVNPTVWFCMDTAIPESSSFYLLDTLMTVKSKEYSYFLPSEDRNVYAIFTQGDGSYQRNDEYGQFTATYTWSAYFDPVSGFIIGYDYTEHDTNPSGTGFTYTEKLYITEASYQLQTGPPTVPDFFSELLKYAVLIVVVLVVVVVILIVYAVSRGRRRLPRHPAQRPVYTPPSEQPPPPPREDIDLTPKQAPVQQIVVKEIVKVNCQYCGALIDSRVTNCPYCGAPRR